MGFVAPSLTNSISLNRENFADDTVPCNDHEQHLTPLFPNTLLRPHYHTMDSAHGHIYMVVVTE